MIWQNHAMFSHMKLGDDHPRIRINRQIIEATGAARGEYPVLLVPKCTMITITRAEIMYHVAINLGKDENGKRMFCGAIHKISIDELSPSTQD